MYNESEQNYREKMYDEKKEEIQRQRKERRYHPYYVSKVDKEKFKEKRREQLRVEQERLLRVEQLRIEREKERLEQERLEQERLRQQRIERERIRQQKEKNIKEQSPGIYEPKRNIITKINIEIPKIEDEFKLPEIEIVKEKDGIDHTFGYDFILSQMEGDDKIVSNKKTKFNNFLCELEFFNWTPDTSKNHYKKIDHVKHFYNLNSYFSYLIRTYGNNVTFLGILSINIDNIDINLIDDDHVSENYLNSKNTKNIIDEIPVGIFSEILGNTYFLVFPIQIFEYIKDSNAESTYSIAYSKKILKNHGNTKYSIIECQCKFIRENQNDGHATYIFINHEKKTVEYYDPHGRNMRLNRIKFIFQSLSLIFEGYEVNRFWEAEGIQNVENIELDEFGFCTIWTSINLHLKLLNIENTLIDNESSLIDYCFTNNFSLYEVMLNYAYYVSRIIPKKFNKIMKLNDYYVKNI